MKQIDMNIKYYKNNYKFFLIDGKGKVPIRWIYGAVLKAYIIYYALKCSKYKNNPD